MGQDPGARRRLADSLAPDVPPRPAPDGFALPVAWMLGPELLGSIRRLVHHLLYHGDLDVRDWMAPEPSVHGAQDGELWFDFISDVGDGQRAMYTTALVCQDDLLVEGTLDELRGARSSDQVKIPAVTSEAGSFATLRRGAFLIVGGDAAYPLSDGANLEARLRQPFVWAYRDLVAAGRLTDDAGAPQRLVDLYGIPSNHDYYDQLVGWNRLFRAPVTEEGVPGPSGLPPPLSLPGFRRRQSASYFALRLPWSWKLWAIDPNDTGIDLRQEWFFAKEGDAEKLILVTPSPPVVLGRTMDDRPLARSLERMKLPAPLTPPATGCRLDLAGDLHHYERYAASEEEATMAVVAGGGGAFHHPSFPVESEVPPRVVYPDQVISRKVVADALFRPSTIMSGGVISVVTFIIAVVMCAGSLLPGTRALSDALFAWLGVHHQRFWPSEVEVPAPGVAFAPLGGALVLSAALLGTLTLLLFALRHARWVARMLTRPPSERSFLARLLPRLLLPSWVLLLAGLALPAATPLIFPWPAPATLIFQLFYLAITAGIVVGCMLLATRVGATTRRANERPVFVLLGVGHTWLQLSMPVVIVRLGLARPWALLIAFGVAAALALAGRASLRTTAPAGRPLSLAVWLLHGIAVVVVLAVASGGVSVAPSGAWPLFLFLLCAGIVGAVVGSIEYGWYLAVAAAYGGHNNEVGAAVRSERFRQMIRFRLEPERLTGYVIAVDEPGTSPSEIRPRIVDVFTVAASRGKRRT